MAPSDRGQQRRVGDRQQRGESMMTCLGRSPAGTAARPSRSTAAAPTGSAGSGRWQHLEAVALVVLEGVLDGILPSRTLVRPTAPSRPSMLATRPAQVAVQSRTRGRLRHAIARLPAVVDLPSPGSRVITTNLAGVDVDELQVRPDHSVRLDPRRMRNSGSPPRGYVMYRRRTRYRLEQARRSRPRHLPRT